MLALPTILVTLALTSPKMNPEITFANISASDSAGIQKTVADLEKAWNTSNIDLYAQQLDEQCHWVNVVGMWWKGKANVVKAHAVYFELMFKGVHQSTEKIDIRGISDGVALAVWTNKLASYKTPDGRVFPESDNRLSLTLVRKSDKWLIVSAQNTIVDPKAAPFNPIKD